MGKVFELIISDEAAEEIEQLRDFNESRRAGQGFLILEDVLDCIERIQKNPNSFQYYKTKIEKIRRGLSKKFSIIILYEVDNIHFQIQILAVADSRQNWFQ